MGATPTLYILFMKKIFNTVNLIDILAPLSYTGFLFEYDLNPEYDIGMHWVTLDELTDNFEFTLCHKDGENITLDNILDHFVDMYVGNPVGLDGSPIPNYWENYVRKYGITKAMFQLSLSKSPFFTKILGILATMIKSFYDGLDLTMNFWQRNPVSGNIRDSRTDTSYKEAFNWGYEWKYGEIFLSFERPTPPYPVYFIDINKLHFTTKSETLFYKNEYNLKKALTTMYPLNLINRSLKEGDTIVFNVAMTLNGYYWLYNSPTTSDYVTWDSRSYGYSSTNFQCLLKYIGTGWEMTCYRNNVQINLADEITRLGIPTDKSTASGNGYARNVGTNWDGKLSPVPGPGGEPVYIPYAPTDIPNRYFIWEY